MFFRGSRKRRLYSEKVLGEKRAHIKKVFLICALLIILILTGVTFGLRNEAILIEDVYVTGNKVLDKDEVREIVFENLKGNYLYVLPRSNILIFPKNVIEKTLLNSFSRIKSIKIKREGLKSINIVISEYEPYSLWCGYEYEEDSTEEQCFFFDNTGYIFSLSPDFSGVAFIKYYSELPEFKNPLRQRIFDSNILEKLNDLISLLNTNEFIVRFVELTEDLDFRIYFEDGSYLLITNDLDVLDDFERFQSLLNSESYIKDESEGGQLEYIDLRFGNKLLYKFK